MSLLRRKVIPAQPERIEETLEVMDEGWSIRSKDGYLSIFLPDFLSNRRIFTSRDLREAGAKLLLLAERVDGETLKQAGVPR